MNLYVIAGVPAALGLALLIAAVRGTTKRPGTRVLLSALGLAVSGSGLVAGGLGMRITGPGCNASRDDCSSFADAFAASQIVLDVGLAFVVAALALAVAAFLSRSSGCVETKAAPRGRPATAPCRVIFDKGER